MKIEERQTKRSSENTHLLELKVTNFVEPFFLLYEGVWYENNFQFLNIKFAPKIEY